MSSKMRHMHTTILMWLWERERKDDAVLDESQRNGCERGRPQPQEMYRLREKSRGDHQHFHFESCLKEGTSISTESMINRSDENKPTDEMRSERRTPIENDRIAQHQRIA